MIRLVDLLFETIESTELVLSENSLKDWMRTATVKNPLTGNEVLVSTALRMPKTSPAYKAAYQQYVAQQQANKNTTTLPTFSKGTNSLDKVSKLNKVDQAKQKNMDKFNKLNKISGDKKLDKPILPLRRKHKSTDDSDDDIFGGLGGFSGGGGGSEF